MSKIKKILKKVSYGVISWLVLLLILYGISAYINKSLYVFMIGGAHTLFIAVILNIIVFGFSYAIPQILSSKKGSYFLEFIYQTLPIILLSVIIFCLSARLTFGFSLWEVDIMFTEDIWQGIYYRGIILILVSLVSGYLGLRIGRKIRVRKKLIR